jgi:SPX domain protein involved in polyphosphate accumulation
MTHSSAIEMPVENSHVELLEQARYESKFVTNVHLYDRLKQWVLCHKAGFREAYPSRRINNIYFDSHDLYTYYENLSGVKDRSKIRLRWYGDNHNVKRAVLEIKTKHNKLGWKYSHATKLAMPLDKLKLSQLSKEIHKVISPEAQSHFELLNIPTLFNQYWRDYYISADGRVRITLDTQLKFFDQRPYQMLNTHFQSRSADVVVMECKYGANDIDLGINTVNDIEIAPTRCSKYVLGINAILGI